MPVVSRRPYMMRKMVLNLSEVLHGILGLRPILEQELLGGIPLSLAGSAKRLRPEVLQLGCSFLEILLVPNRLLNYSGDCRHAYGHARIPAQEMGVAHKNSCHNQELRWSSQLRHFGAPGKMAVRNARHVAWKLAL